MAWGAQYPVEFMKLLYPQEEKFTIRWPQKAQQTGQ
jgi:hypothetical protein